MSGKIFHRPGRTYPNPVPQEAIIIVTPPVLPQNFGIRLSWMAILVPLLSSIGLIAFIFINPSPILIIVYMVMFVAIAGGSFLMQYQQAGNSRQQLLQSRAKYERYLEQQRIHLDDVVERQQQVGRRIYPSLPTLTTYVERQEYLWERRSTDKDFLEVRLASGAGSLSCPLRLDMGQNPLADFDQESLIKAQLLIAKYSQVDNVPITLPLRTLGTLAITGDRARARALVRAMLCHITAFQAPEDVRLVTYFPSDATAEWTWMKWLPHGHLLHPIKVLKDRQVEPYCLMTDNAEDFQELLTSQLLPELERRRKLLTEEAGRTLNPTVVSNQAKPHFVIILDGFSPAGALARIPLLNELFGDAEKVGVTLLCLIGDAIDEPPLLQARLRISETGWFAFEETAPNGRRVAGITADHADLALCEGIARDLAPLVLGDKGREEDLSQDVRLLELLGFPSADALDTGNIWRLRDRANLLRVPIGITAKGNPLFLDIKESAAGGMGPHGLIIGATGSGKSELLRTIVTSLAITHNPEFLNFVLADFKGGASFADLAKLPHAAGLITNLQSDLTQIDRVRASLSGEQERRQRMLREAGNLDNIREYQARRQAIPTLPPMPYLMIIVDEFAELLVNRPAFLDLFVAIGRVGRSLGMHLLLATQRLGEGRIQGLEGHLRYRICLRTFSASESTDVLGTVDAFYLPSFPGIGYFKVDTTVYEQFKTALISTPYVPASEQAKASVVIQRFMPNGKLVLGAPQVDSRGASGVLMAGHDSLQTDMDVVITRVVDTTVPLGPVHQVLLPPLATYLTLGDVFALQKQNNPQPPQPGDESSQSSWSGLKIPIGILDKPAEQIQEPYLLDFLGSSGHLAIVGAPQTGKSTLLQTIITAFTVTQTPHDVQLYCVDLGGGLLRVFETAPHVGAVCGKAERDKARRLIRKMRTIIEDRENLFREYRIDSMASFRERRHAGEFADVPFGDVFLIIDDMALFQSEFEGLTDEVSEIVAAGLTFGVHVILATGRWNDMRPKLRDNIGGRLELRLNDPLESEAGREAALSIPVGVPGRGLIKSGLQFQTALPRLDSGEEAHRIPLQRSLDALVSRLGRNWPNVSAPPIRILPDLITVADLPPVLPGSKEPAGVLLGLEELQLAPVYLDLITSGPHFILLGDAECGKTTLLRNWLQQLEAKYTPEQVRFAVIDPRRTLQQDAAHSTHSVGYAFTTPMANECVDRFKSLLEGRVITDEAQVLSNSHHGAGWTGPHYFLFVDDYETFSQGDNPLMPLLDLIGQGRDIGFHLVLSRRVGGASRAAFESVFQRVKEMGSPGLIMSGDPMEGPLLGTQRPAKIPPGRGYLIRRNYQPTLIQTVFVEQEVAARPLR